VHLVVAADDRAIDPTYGPAGVAGRLTGCRRVLQVLTVLARHGARYLVARIRRLGLSPAAGRPPGSSTRQRVQQRAAALRRLLEDLGVAAIKIGQIVSTRPDVLAPEYEVELSRLQDSAPPEPAWRIEAVIATELGRPTEAVFAHFDRIPLAAASIGQAHAATLSDGTDVVVKVRRPGVVEQVAADLRILEWAARTICRLSSRARRQGVAGLVEEFADTLRAELDYVTEADNAERFARAFRGDESIHIPRVFRGQSTGRVITLERIRGLKLSDLAGLQAAGVDRVQLARRAANAILKMVFEDGFFHADPHPGNFFVEPDGRLGVIDFGMVGVVDDITRSALLGVLVALASGDTTVLADGVTNLGMTAGEMDQDALLLDLKGLIASHLERPLGQIDVGPLLQDVLAIFRRHHLRITRNLALLTKTFAMCEGVAGQLDPSFRMTTAIIPYVQHLIAASDGPNGPDRSGASA
jgi:ubiquinone biosynthesis protein